MASLVSFLIYLFLGWLAIVCRKYSIRCSPNVTTDDWNRLLICFWDTIFFFLDSVQFFFNGGEKDFHTRLNCTTVHVSQMVEMLSRMASLETILVAFLVIGSPGTYVTFRFSIAINEFYYRLILVLNFLFNP